MNHCVLTAEVEEVWPVKAIFEEGFDENHGVVIQNETAVQWRLSRPISVILGERV